MEWLFAASLLLVCYTYFGYPLQLWVVSRLFPVPIQRGAETPDVVIIVVAHNEARRIRDKIRTCLAQEYPPEHLTLLVVSDGSSDTTNEIVRAIGDSRVQLLAFPHRRGKAACLNDGVAFTKAPIIVFSDARQRLHPKAVSRLVSSFADPSIGVVSGELEFEREDASPFADGIGAYWRYEKFIRLHEARSGSVVGVTGALYAIRRQCFYPIPQETLLDDVAIPMQAALRGWRVSFESGALAYDVPSTDAAKEAIRKVRTLAGNFQLLALYPEWLDPRKNPLWGRLVAHKLLRLVCPIALVVALLSHGILALRGGPVLQVTGMLHVAAYACVVCAMALPSLQRLTVLRLGVTFLQLNTFVVRGFLSFVKGNQSQQWASSTAESTP